MMQTTQQSNALSRTIELTESNSLFKLNHPFWGKHFAHIGHYIPPELFKNIPYHHHITPTAEHSEEDIIASPKHLPFATKSIDIIFLQRALDTYKSPEPILHEAQRVLKDQGTLIITGLNASSLWGVKKLVYKHSDQYPWNTHFHKVQYILNWLRNNNFLISNCETHLYTIPTTKTPEVDKHDFIQKLCPNLGGLYLIIARQNIIPLNPLVDIPWSTKPSWWQAPPGLKPAHRIKPMQNKKI